MVSEPLLHTSTMASSSSSTPTLGHLVTEKLSKNNYAIWKIQVLPAVRAAHLAGYLDGTSVAPAAEIEDKEGKKPMNPAYAAWVTKDQNLLSYLLSTLSRYALAEVSTCAMAAQV